MRGVSSGANNGAAALNGRVTIGILAQTLSSDRLVEIEVIAA